ncbi:MAG: hypothetical protein MUP53_03295, partial [Bacteroidales bacterium]|nr:hypothetical protein [Bacteroidales bacterium]
MEKIFGFFLPFFTYIFIFILNVLLPGRWVTGYVNRPGSTEKLKYRLNGLLVLAVVLVTWIILCYTGVMDWDWLYKYRWYTLAGAVTFGLIFSFAIVLPFPAVKKSFFTDFYLGR